MSYICENELRDIYNMLAPVLTQHGFACEIAMIRDYMLKIWIDEDGQRLGKLIVHYSPKKNSFSYRKDSDLSQEQYDRVVSLLTGQISMGWGLSCPGEKENCPKPQKDKSVAEIDFNTLSTQYQAFVDGSFIESQIGYGAVILDRVIQLPNCMEGLMILMPLPQGRWEARYGLSSKPWNGAKALNRRDHHIL